MTELHASLRNKLDRMRAEPVMFDRAKSCFTVGGRTKHGLTKLLAEAVPVPRSMRSLSVEERAATDTPPEVRVQMFAGSTLRRCGHCDAAVKWTRTAPGLRSSIGERVRAERNIDRAHGLVVDYQLSLYARTSRDTLFRTCAVVDPCVGTLLEQLDANAWCIVATQLPIYDAASDCATAIDVLATDRATRTDAYLIEIKAIRGKRNRAGTGGGESDANYVCVRGTLKRSVLRDLPQSYYARHQLQLLWMNDAVQRQLGFSFDRAVLMRVSPGIVRSYPLTAQFQARSTQVRQAVAYKTGKLKKPAAAVKRARQATSAPAPKRRRKGK